MEKLISLREFVLNKSKESKSFSEPLSFINSVTNYVNFLSEPLQLWMFVPCDENNVPLEEPKQVSPDGVKWEDYVKQYQQAKERCYFEGFELIKRKDYYVVQQNGNDVWVSWNESKIVEDILWANATLTQTAKNRIL